MFHTPVEPLPGPADAFGRRRLVPKIVDETSQDHPAFKFAGEGNPGHGVAGAVPQAKESALSLLCIKFAGS